MVSASRIQTLLMCAKAQEMRLILPDGFSVGYILLGTRLASLVLRPDLRHDDSTSHLPYSSLCCHIT